MSEAKWSPEPWRHNDGTWMWDAEGKAHWLDVGGDRSSEDKRRIVACVNACASIPTEALESGALGKALGLAADILAHTDPECDTENCETKHGLISALRSLGRLK